MYPKLLWYKYFLLHKKFVWSSLQVYLPTYSIAWQEKRIFNQEECLCVSKVADTIESSSTITTVAILTSQHQFYANVFYTKKTVYRNGFYKHLSHQDPYKSYTDMLIFLGFSMDQFFAFLSINYYIIISYVAHRKKKLFLYTRTKNMY